MILENMPLSQNVYECGFKVVENLDRALVAFVPVCEQVEFFSYDPVLSWLITIIAVSLLLCIIYNERLKL